MPPYEYGDHPADLEIRAWGETLEELLTDIAQGVLDAMVDTSTVEARQEYPITVSADSLEDLLVNWLSELLYQHEIHEVFFKSVMIRRCDPTQIDAVAYGEPMDWDRHIVHGEIKNVTYHQLFIRQREGRWEAHVILDL